MTCCRGAGLMPEGLPGRCQERLGTRGNPQFHARAGHIHTVWTEKISFLLKILSLLLSIFPNWSASDIIWRPFWAIFAILIGPDSGPPK